MGKPEDVHASCASTCSTLSVEDFVALLIRCGFVLSVYGLLSDWYTKTNCSVGPVYTLWINPIYGVDGCTLTQNACDEESIIDIRMPETEEEFRILCRALGVELNA